ncbi:MAG: hypothetical protein GY754_46510 [bacterium]|nr:hypothetical protein [bacterium]
MSYDLKLYTIDKPIPEYLNEEGNDWKEYDTSICYEKKNWQIVVSFPDKVLTEDIPGEVISALPGIEYQVEITLEPISAPKAAYNQFNKISKQIAQNSHGVIFDPQNDEIILPSGIKRFVKPKKEERFNTILMSWWFSDTFLNSKADIETFVNILKNKIPEILPKRYGFYEPPQHKLSETSLEHFTKFLWENLSDFIVWYPGRPVIDVHIGYSKERMHNRLGFRSNYLKIEFEQSVLLQKGWAKLLKDFWEEISLLFNPFYGDVRTIRGNLWSGATSASDMQTEFHPVRAGFWRGIPITLGQSVVLGKIYADTWPEYAKKSKRVGDLYFLDTDRWMDEKEISMDTKVPGNISHKHIPKWVEDRKSGGYSQNWNEEYPPVWPFGEIRSQNTEDQ